MLSLDLDDVLFGVVPIFKCMLCVLRSATPQ